MSGRPGPVLGTACKSIGFGLAVGLAAFGTALGVGLIFASMLQSASRQPEAKKELTPIMWLGFALTEAVIFYGLVGAMLLVFLDLRGLTMRLNSRAASSLASALRPCRVLLLFGGVLRSPKASCSRRRSSPARSSRSQPAS